MMYRIFRNTHLFLGLFCGFFLLMYGMSAIQMSHQGWFNLRPEVTTTEANLAAGQTDARALARELSIRYQLRGDLSQANASPTRIAVSISRPGTVYEVDYEIASGRTTIRNNRQGLIGLLNRIHHVAGLRYNYWLMNAWAVFVGIVSVALIVMGVTGIYLWFKIQKERVVGGILLAISLGYSLTLMVLARLAW